MKKKFQKVKKLWPTPSTSCPTQKLVPGPTMTRTGCPISMVVMYHCKAHGKETSKSPGSDPKMSKNGGSSCQHQARKTEVEPNAMSMLL